MNSGRQGGEVMRALAVVMLAGAVLAAGVRAQGPIPRGPVLEKTTVGSELYRFYCSNCHGLDARGRPATPAMRTPSTDLTALSLNHGGVFPREMVRDVITHGTGRGSVHGTTDMPVWGTIFRAFEPNDKLVDVRIDNLVRYLESLQSTAIGTRQSE
jgi:mono/diheme cytochrome c family protein